VFLCDGYAATAEALQAASLAEALDVEVSMALFTSHFDLPIESERRLARLDPDAPEFASKLGALFGKALDPALVEQYRSCLHEMVAANMPVARPVIHADDFFPEKEWRVLATAGYMGPDPYTGLPGVKQVGDHSWQVTTQLAARGAGCQVTFVFRFLESFEQTRLVFSPLLERFVAGEDYRKRPVKISDSGRIRNELQTLCSPALEYSQTRIRVHFDRIDDLVIRADKKRKIREVLEWYQESHPVWFSWLDIA
jgi:hypothetical protein